MSFLNSTELDNLKIVQLEQSVDFTLLHKVNPERYPFLLESSAQAENIFHLNPNVPNCNSSEHARFDILFAFPQDSLSLYSNNDIDGKHADLSKDFLSNVDDYWLKHKNNAKINADLPFTGGWFIYLSYELADQIEERLSLPQSKRKSLKARLTRIPVALIKDKLLNKLLLVAESDYAEKLTLIQSDINSLVNMQSVSNNDVDDIELNEETPSRYIDSIKKIKQYIKDGDVFQVNLSRLWVSEKHCNLNAIALYNALKDSNPAPFSAYVDYGNYKIISSSPERLVKVKDNKVQTRPIAGTRARHNDSKDDIDDLKELISHPKERAEHIMLIDLERNDLGRICKPGSIQVDELMVLESFQHVHHIVSNVSGELKEDITPGDVLRAVFPGGTITGCPKERCMQIIAELENAPRGAYTGSVGYINHDGSMDLNILIRTFEILDDVLSLRAGAGLVNDSIAEKELEETRAKAKGLLEALH